VIENDGADMDQARGMVQSLLAENPCAEAARSELEAGVSAETPQLEVRSIFRAMSILTSDTCEVVEPNQTEENIDLDVQLSEIEGEVQDAIDGMVEQTEDGDGAFIQTSSGIGLLRRFMRALGVALLMLFLLLACVGAAAAIGMFLGAVFAIMVAEVTRMGGEDGSWMALAWGFYGIGVGGVVGLGGCSYQLYTQLISRS